MQQTSPSITVTINTSPRDFYALQVRYLLRKQWWLPLGMGVMLYGVTGLSPLGGIAGAILGAGLIPILPLTQWRARKRNPNFSATTVYTFSDRGVALEWPTTSVRYDWAAIKRCTETAKYLLIHVPPEWFYFIPKRELHESELKGITDILRTYPPLEKRLRETH